MMLNSIAALLAGISKVSERYPQVYCQIKLSKDRKNKRRNLFCLSLKSALQIQFYLLAENRQSMNEKLVQSRLNNAAFVYLTDTNVSTRAKETNYE